MRAWIGTEGDAVTVDVQIAAKLFSGLQLGSSHDFAAVIFARVIPRQRLRQVMIHANVEVEHDEDWRLQPVREVKGLRTEGERLRRIFRKEQHVLGIAVRGVSAGHDVTLLRTCRHARGRTGPLDVEEDGWNFSKIGKADKLLH